jgi:hypothetical protein
VNLTDWTRTECKPSLVTYEWHGWIIDQWVKDDINVLWKNGRPVMEFGPVERLAARAAELEAESDR